MKSAKPRAKAKRRVSEPMTPRLLDTKHAAQYCNVSYWKMLSPLQKGCIPVVKFPSMKYESRLSRRVLIDKSDLDAWLDARKRVGL